ncbi:hypothetical protein C7S18_00700 [Ahniella affigens]|uniref:Protein kinase domain-containing protein n=1 Tax=Ahniella affigens TaxID=2021234 RepID=A0A2P1PLU6_9GAMM|nr:serine/threonine-protein kinase [Ahniella affigens]AVP95806.1 hypothetical protein C7S18_00700 [Ahniella affigens]
MTEGAAAATPLLNPAQYARVKALFYELAEQSVDAKHQAVAALHDDPIVQAELRRLLAHAGTTLSAAPLHAAVTDVARAPTTGSTLGAYTLQEVIGAGGMGKVFRAERSDGHFQQQAAVKLLGGVPSAAALRTLARERQILATLTHPNIARLLDGGSTPGGQPYLVMEYVDGLPLLDYCQRHHVSQQERLNLLREICAAVGFAHQRLVVHCDLKPSNILVMPNGRPMLLDFGISRLLEDAELPNADSEPRLSTPPGTTQLSYTPRYASPEQKAGKRVSTATDVYSLGLLLAETLDAPWPESESLPDLSRLPIELAAIIKKATAEQPEQRYASIERLAEDLRRYASHEAVLALPARFSYLARKWLWRHWVPVSVGALFLIVLSGFSWQMRAERDSAQAAERAARAVKDYMVTVFQGADPEQGGRRDLPVSQFLDAGLHGLQASLQDQPATRAELATILGSVYQNIGQRQQALDLYDEAITVAKAGNMPAALGEALHRKAYSLYDMEDFAAAVPLARDALTLRAQFAPNSSAHLASLRLLGSILSYQRETVEAEAFLQEALQRANSRFGADTLEAAMAHLDLARHDAAQEDRGVSVLNHATIAGSLFRQHLGPDHFRVADALEMHVIGQSQSGEPALAIPDAALLVDLRRKRFGELSYPYSYALQVQGGTLRWAGHYREAIGPLAASVAIHDQLDGPGSLGSKVPLHGLALAEEAAGLSERAMASYQRLLLIQQQDPANAGESNAVLQYGIARNQRFTSARLAAEQALSALLQQAHHDADFDPALLIDIRIDLAALARERRAFAEAQSHLDAIVDAATSTPGYFAERGQLALAEGKLEAAKADFDRALALATANDGADATSTRLLLINHVQWLQASGRASEARIQATDLRQELQALLAPDGRWMVLLEQLASKS